MKTPKEPVVAAILGAAVGGAVALIVTRAIPRMMRAMMSEMMGTMEAGMGVKGCGPAEIWQRMISSFGEARQEKPGD